MLKSEDMCSGLIEQTPVITYITTLGDSSKTLFVSSQVEAILGFKPDEWKKGNGIWHDQIHPDDRDRVMSEIKAAHTSREPFLSEYRMLHRNGQIIWISDQAKVVRDEKDNNLIVQGAMLDITDQRKLEYELRVSHDILYIANKHTEMQPMLKEVIAYIKDFIGCDAVGIRILDDNGNIPYEAYDGFDQVFFTKENHLSIKTDRCWCINVIKGYSDPTLPFHTAKGSIHVNGTTRFLAGLSEEEKGRTRATCNQHGFESLALIPISAGERILGLIHIADNRENMVPLWLIEILEVAAVQLAQAINRLIMEEGLKQAHNELESRIEERTGQLSQLVDELRISEEALRKSEERFRTLVDNIPGVSYRCAYDENWTMEFISAEIEFISGYPVTDFIQNSVRSYASIIHPEDAQMVNDIAKQAIEAKKVYTVEYRIINVNNETRWVFEKGQGLFNADRQLLHLDGTIIDITKRKRRESMAQAQIRFSEFASNRSVEELLQAFLDEAEKLTDSQIGFFHFIEKDQKTIQLQAWSTNTLKNMCTVEGTGTLYAIDQAGIWMDCVRKGCPVVHNDYESVPHRKGLPKGHAPVTRELSVPVYRGGKIVAVLGVGNKQSDYNDEDINIVLDMANMAWDTVGRKQAENKLKESEANLVKAQEAAHIGSWNLDLLENKLVWTAEIHRLFGIPIGSPLSYEKFLEAVHPDDRDFVDNKWNAALKGEPYDIEHRLLINNEVKWVSEKAELNFDDSGKPISGVGITQDITDQKLAEGEITRLRDEYTHIARVSAMGVLTASLAHELKQPLTAIGSNAQAALSFLSTDIPNLAEVQEILDDIISDNQRADEIIVKLRSLMQKGKVQIVELDINEVIQEIFPVVHSYEVMKNISMTFDFVDGIEFVAGDRVQLQQVLLNLILNSSQALMEVSPDSRKIVIQTKQQDQKSVTISVSDNGPGIDEQIIDHLFEPFCTSKKDGMGMGLPVCKSIIETHGGRLWAENNTDCGVTFYFTLPIFNKDSK